jgi:hypothetical protein
MSVAVLGPASLVRLFGPAPTALAHTERPARYEPIRSRTTTFHRQHGQRERGRRLRQIAAGSLRAENGLVGSEI